MNVMFFFFSSRRRHTTFKCDWSSDVCSSDLDALRFALVHGTTPGQDQKFGQAKVENARNFANKLWNATRYVIGARPASIAEDAERRLPDAAHVGPADRWVLSRAAA